MKRQINNILVISFLIVILFDTAPADNLSVGNMEFDRVKWGMMDLTVPFNNPRNDTARVSVNILTLFHEHYLSGLERFPADTSIAVVPLSEETYKVPFEMPASYGTAVVRVKIHWRFDNPEPDDPPVDSVGQTFRAFLKIPESAAKYINQKHSIGPVYSMLDHELIMLEFPRLFLYLRSRGMSLNKIASTFEVETDYAETIYQRLKKDGFFPLAKDSLAPGIVAITEQEGYIVRARLNAAVRMFASWYDRQGHDELDQIMNRAGVDEFARRLPALQMSILLNLLGHRWVVSESGFDIARFQNIEKDLKNLNRPRWIVEGGEFFLPKLCLAAFEDDGMLHLTTFCPDPDLPYDKAPVFNMRKTVEESSGSTPIIDASQIRKIIREAEKANLLNFIADDLRSFILTVRPEIKKFKRYQAPYLADYVYRFVLGGYFDQHKPDQDWIDCVRIRY